MPRTIPSEARERFIAPRWTWRPVFLAGAVTLGIYVLLPYLERATAPPDPTLAVRSVGTAKLPPPPPPPPRTERKPPADRTQPSKPQLEEQRRRLAPMQAALNLGMAIGNVGGDFDVDFGMTAEALGAQVKQLVFEIGELDEPPRPLARLDPIYPPQARMRRIEGSVLLEFVVAADGSVRDVVVASSHPGDLFVSSAVRAVERWRFVPGSKGGESVATRVRQRVEFKLE
jgi:periplasmic protein TonB